MLYYSVTDNSCIQFYHEWLIIDECKYEKIRLWANFSLCLQKQRNHIVNMCTEGPACGLAAMPASCIRGAVSFLLHLCFSPLLMWLESFGSDVPRMCALDFGLAQLPHLRPSGDWTNKRKISLGVLLALLLFL